MSEKLSAKLIEDYLRLREEKTRRIEAHKKDIARITRAMSVIEDQMISLLRREGISSIRTKKGTVFQTVKRFVSVKSKDEFFQFVRDTENWSFLEARCKKNEAQAYLEEYGTTPPGVDVVSVNTVGFHQN